MGVTNITTSLVKWDKGENAISSETIFKQLTVFQQLLDKIHFQFLYPLSSFSVGYKSESNNANDSKKEDLSQQLGI